VEVEVEVEVADMGAETGIGVGEGLCFGKYCRYLCMCGMHVVAALKILLSDVEKGIGWEHAIGGAELDSKLLGSFGDLGESIQVPAPPILTLNWVNRDTEYKHKQE
jgi:hypothetical protein